MAGRSGLQWLLATVPSVLGFAQPCVIKTTLPWLFGTQQPLVKQRRHHNSSEDFTRLKSYFIIWVDLTSISSSVFQDNDCYRMPELPPGFSRRKHKGSKRWGFLFSFQAGTWGAQCKFIFELLCCLNWRSRWCGEINLKRLSISQTKLAHIHNPGRLQRHLRQVRLNQQQF